MSTKKSLCLFHPSNVPFHVRYSLHLTGETLFPFVAVYFLYILIIKIYLFSLCLWAFFTQPLKPCARIKFLFSSCLGRQALHCKEVGSSTPYLHLITEGSKFNLGNPIHKCGSFSKWPPDVWSFSVTNKRPKLCNYVHQFGHLCEMIFGYYFSSKTKL